jgi:hypothetical protein
MQTPTQTTASNNNASNTLSPATQTALASYRLMNQTTPPLPPTSRRSVSTGSATAATGSVPISPPLIPDNISELSDATYQSAIISDVSISSNSDMMKRSKSTSSAAKFSSLISSNHAVHEKYGSNGSEYLTEDMVVFVKENNVSLSESQMIVGLSVSRPTALLGWQVMVFLDAAQSVVDGKSLISCFVCQFYIVN